MKVRRIISATRAWINCLGQEKDDALLCEPWLDGAVAVIRKSVGIGERRRIEMKLCSGCDRGLSWRLNVKNIIVSLLSLVLSGCMHPLAKTYQVNGVSAEVGFVRRANTMDVEGRKIYRIYISHGDQWYEVFQGIGWDK